MDFERIDCGFKIGRKMGKGEWLLAQVEDMRYTMKLESNNTNYILTETTEEFSKHSAA